MSLCPEELSGVRRLPLGEHRVLVRLHAVARAAGTTAPYAERPAAYDGAGVVRRVGSAVAQVRVGDRVFGRFLAPAQDGRRLSEYTSIPQWSPLAPVPPSLSFADAAACISPGLAAQAAVDAVQPRRGDRAVVVPGTHAVSMLVIQLVSARGASVTTSGTAAEAELPRSLGASQVIDSDRGDLNARVRRRHPRGVDAVVDAAGDSAAATARAEILRAGGRLAAVNGLPRLADFARRRATAVRVMPRPTTARLLELACALQDGHLNLGPDPARAPRLPGHLRLAGEPAAAVGANSAVGGQAHTAPAQAAIDTLIGTYVDWDEESAAVQNAYRRWAIAGGARLGPAFGAYRAALEREEAAAAAHARAVQQARAV